MNYTPNDKLEFQGRDKRVAFESLFRTLCDYYKGDTKIDLKKITEQAKGLVDWLFATYPLQEVKDEPFPTNNPTIGSIPKICPECGANIKHKTGTSKTGKGYDFWGCSNFPDCKWVYKPKK